MAKTISLDIEQIKRLNTEISALDDTLLRTYLPNMDSILTAVGANLLSNEVNATLTRIKNQIDSVKSSLSVELPKLEDFLNTQLASYSISEDEASSALKSTIIKMNELMGVSTAKGTVTSGATSDATTTSGNDTADKYAHNWGGKYSETWNSWWSDVSEAYSDTHGLFSAVGNTVEAALDTGGAVLETAANGISDLAHSLGNVIGWILG